MNYYLSAAMQSTIFFITQIMLILLVFGLISTLRYGLRYAYTRLSIPLDFQRKQLWIGGGGLLLWLGGLAILAGTGIFAELDRTPPLLFYVLLPPLLFFWGLLFWPPFRRLLKLIPKTWLFYAQTYRILTDLILWLGYLAYFVPKQLTFLWLNQDYTVGLTAIVAGMIFFGRGQNRKFEGIIWNVFGIILLFNQVFLGYISLPMPDPVMNTGIDSIFLTRFPFIWLWGFTIPLGFGLHVASLYQILFLNQPGRRRRFSLQRKPKK
ncbi:MAG TPA: hypothetical protein VJ953_20265 [Saprospiraceae bacterium]|nr:hypothetical protein [Saprospiraceae bacterium]